MLLVSKTVVLGCTCFCRIIFFDSCGNVRIINILMKRTRINLNFMNPFLPYKGCHVKIHKSHGKAWTSLPILVVVGSIIVVSKAGLDLYCCKILFNQRLPSLPTPCPSDLPSLCQGISLRRLRCTTKWNNKCPKISTYFDEFSNFLSPIHPQQHVHRPSWDILVLCGTCHGSNYPQLGLCLKKLMDRTSLSTSSCHLIPSTWCTSASQFLKKKSQFRFICVCTCCHRSRYIAHLWQHLQINTTLHTKSTLYLMFAHVSPGTLTCDH